MNDGFDYDVFLSYNRLDHSQVEDVARNLCERGLKVFLDRWQLAGGLSWPPLLESAMSRCAAFVTFIGPHGMGHWQQDEKYLALDTQAHNPQFPVIPVLGRGTATTVRQPRMSRNPCYTK